jgi:hypothetical protein
MAAILGRSDERTHYERRLLNNWRAGYEAAELAHADDYDRGYADGILGRKHAEHLVVDAARLFARRWELRGEARIRETFGRPHPADFAGRGDAA